MSALTINIDLPPESQALIQRFRDAPQELPQAIKRGMDRALEVVASRIQEKRLAGRGPFPPAEHRLGERTGQLRQSVRATPATITGNEITGAIGTPVIYGRVHEFGFQGTVRYRTKTGKSATRKMNVPERAPFRTGAEENKDYIRDTIGTEIVTSLPK